MRALLLLALLCLAAACEPRDLRFAAVPWGSDPAEVRRLLERQGYAWVGRANARGDQLYAGDYAGRRAVVVARMAAGRLAKVEVGIRPADGKRGPLFNALERDLAAEYGRRAGTVRVEADAAGRSVWSRGSRGGEGYLILENRPDLAIVISWESPDWHAEFLRRQAP